MAEYKSRYRKSRLLDTNDDLGLKDVRPIKKNHGALDLKLEGGNTIEMILYDGIPLSAHEGVPGILLGLEPLLHEKNFFFEEVKIGELGMDQLSRYSYNVFTQDGSRIFLIANSCSLTDPISSQYFTYEVYGGSHEDTPFLVLEGDQFGGVCDVCCCCCVCKPIRGIKVQYHDGLEIGKFQPIRRKIMPCLFSCRSFCYCYISKYEIFYVKSSRLIGHEKIHPYQDYIKINDSYVNLEDENPSKKIPLLYEKLESRIPKRSVKRRDIGLEIVDLNKNIVGRISNCIINAGKKSILPAQLQNTKLMKQNIEIQFGLSFADEFIDLDPNAKIVLMAFAIFHESEVMLNQRGNVKDSIGFISA